MGTLIPLRIAAPGFFGLNTQVSTFPGLQWAKEADNCVIDVNGRLAARKGRRHLTATPISGAPALRTVFEQIRADGTKTILSAGGNKLYSGTTALTDITGTAGSVTGITADHWQLQNIADYCVGFQAGHDPIARTTGDFGLLQQLIPAWAASTAYTAGNVRRATSAHKTLYFHCTTSGTSGGSEPAWNTNVGGTTTDGTVVWTTRKMPNGNCCHSAFGRLWATSAGDNSVIEFSDTLLPHVFRGGSAGTLDLKTVWGGDSVTAISSIEDYLVVFGERTILLYAGPEVPATMTLAEKIEGVGCIARDSVASTGKDLLFLSSSGVRSLSRALQAGRQPLGDLSVNVRDALRADVAIEPAANVKAVYQEADGFYALLLTGRNRVWVFDTRYPNPDASAKVTTWSGMSVYAAHSASTRVLYLGGSGVIAQYDGYLDGDAGTYALVYKSSWTDFSENDPGSRIGIAPRIKIPKSWRSLILTSAAYTATLYWAFDYSPTLYADTVALQTEAAGGEWGIMEWGIGEWSGGNAFVDTRAHPTSHGQVMQIGYKVVVNGASIAFQEVLLAAKLGRFAA